jgi:hypothetical protein
MLIADVPYVPAQDTPIVLAQAATPSVTPPPDYIFNKCKETESTGSPRSATRGVNPVGMLAAYIENHSQRLIDRATEAAIKLTLVEGTTQGKLNPHTTRDGRLYYMYDPTPNYIGNDRAVFLAEFEGKVYKIVVELHVFEGPATPGDSGASTCPPPQLIKVTKPSSSGSSYSTNYELATLSVSYQPNPPFERDAAKARRPSTLRCASMKTFALLASLIALWLAPAVSHAADACSAVMRELPSDRTADIDGCVCDARPKNLREEHTSSFRIVAACNLRWKPGKPINPATQQEPLEELNKSYPFGAIFMSGEATLEGKLEANELEQWHMYLDKPIVLGDVVYKVGMVEVGMPPKNILVFPEHLRNSSCLQGRAKVTVKNLFIWFYDINTAAVSTHEPVFQSATLDRRCWDYCTTHRSSGTVTFPQNS